jgi:splicing factor 1
MTAEQLEAYVIALRIEEITQNLRAGNVVPAPHRGRSPSPEPEYDGAGRRTNTRTERHRKRLEDERHRLVEDAMRTIPQYRAPYDYRRPTVFREKVYVPVDEHPHISFIGQILGPRGNSLKAMNSDSGANIVIRGRGSVKEGRGHNRSNQKTSNSNDLSEPLHCLVTADSQQKVNKAKELLNTVIYNAISAPEYDNDRKRQQLRDLAMINGTFRDDERLRESGRLIQHTGNACPKIPESVLTTSKRTHETMVEQGADFDDEYEKLLMDVSGTTNTDHVSQHSACDRIPPWRRMRQ